MSKRVLIVEDEIFVALEIEHIVETAGFSVCAIAADRTAALDAAGQCDIALVDINLRDGATGPEIGQTLAANHGVRIIYVTANPAQIGPAADIALGVIAKPFSAATITGALMMATGEDAGLRSEIVGFTPFCPRPGSTPAQEYAG